MPGGDGCDAAMALPVRAPDSPMGGGGEGGQRAIFIETLRRRAPASHYPTC